MSNDAKKRGYWTAAELGNAGGVSDARIRQLLLEGKLRGDKAGAVWTIPYSEGQRWLDERKKTDA